MEVLPHATNSSAYPYERRSVLAATYVSANTTTITLDNPLSGVLELSQILLTWSEPAWWKARILDTTRELRTDGGPPRYTTSLLTFVIEEEIPA